MVKIAVYTLKGLSAALLFFLAGCANNSAPVSPPGNTVPDVSAPVTVPSGREPSRAVRIRPGSSERSTPLAAVSALVRDAWAQYRAGKLQDAIATAERGLRIQRSSAELYLLLAKAYMALDNHAQANTFAHQGLRYSHSSGLRSELESVISQLNLR